MNPDPGDIEGEDDLGEFGKAMQQTRTQLQDNGPEVDYAALFGYVDSDLPPEQHQDVERRISTWRRWHDAYWELRAQLAAFAESGRMDLLGVGGVESMDRTRPESLALVNWLTVPLAPPLPRLSALHEWACYLVQTLRPYGTLQLLGTLRGGRSTGVGAQGLLPDLANYLQSGHPVQVTDPEKWVYLVLRGGNIEIRAGRNASEAFDQFGVEFRFGERSVVHLQAVQAVVRLTPEVLAALPAAEPGSLVLTISEVKTE